MNRSAIAMSAALGLAVLAGCGNSSEPSAPPTSEDALTTTPPAVTSEPEPAETTEAELTTEAPTADPMDQTEDGAEAFVDHYFVTLNAVHTDEADVEYLRSLATSECRTCTALADAAEKSPFGRDYAKVASASALLLGPEARVDTELEQVADGALVGAVVTLQWGNDTWHVTSIQAASR